MYPHISQVRVACVALATAFVLSACGGESAGDDSGEGSSNLTHPGTFALERESYTVGEDDGAVVVLVRRLDGSQGQVNVDYQTVQYDTTVSNRAMADGGSGDGDYERIEGTVAFGPGETRKSISIPVSDDDVEQGDRVFGFRLTEVDRGRIGTPGKGRVKIVDDERGNASREGRFRLSASAYEVAENAGSIAITVERVDGDHGAASVRYSTGQYDPPSAHDSDFGVADDYDGSTGLLEFADGQTRTTFTVPITDDAQYTDDLRFGVYLFEASTELADPNEAAVTIVDNESPPQNAPGELRLSDSTFGVSESGGSVRITVDRVNGDAGTVSVDYATYDLGDDDTALAGSDYRAGSGTLTFADGETRKSFSVGIVDDDQFTGDATFGVRLSDATTDLTSPQDGVVTIIEDEVEPGPTGAFRMHASSYVVSEGGGSAQFTVERVNGASGAASVDYATVNTGSGDGYAVAGEDYDSRGGTLSFADGQSQATFSVPILDDSQYTGSLAFAVRLSNAETSLASPSEAGVTITDDEDEPVATGDMRFSASDYTIDEAGDAVSVTVERVNGTTGEVRVDYATRTLSTGDGDAVAGSDFQGTSGTLVFADGVTHRSFQVGIVDDDEYTGDLAFGVRLSGADTGVASPSDATVTIVDDESSPQEALELVWDAPTTNADGSCLEDLAGFRVNYGLSSGDYGNAQTMSLDELTSTPTGRSTDCGEVVAYVFPLDGLDTASWYITVQARDDSGNLSEHSEEIVITVE